MREHPPQPKETIMGSCAAVILLLIVGTPIALWIGRSEK